MKVKVLGFEPVPDILPKAVSAAAGFEWMTKHPGYELNQNLIVSCTAAENLFAGVVLKARDSKSFMRMQKAGGMLKSEKLPDGHQLAEASFFVAHPRTGRGLFSYHYMSASLLSDFSWCVAKTFHAERKELLEQRLQAPGITPKEQKSVRQSHRGRYLLSQLLNGANLKDFLKKLKRVTSFEAKFSTFDLKEDIFDPLSKFASRKSVQLHFAPDVALAHIEQAIEDAATSGELDDFWIVGRDRKEAYTDFNRTKNPMIFSEYEYDDLMGTLDIDFSKWHDSIVNAEAAKKLLAIAKSGSVATMLKALP